MSISDLFLIRSIFSLCYILLFWFLHGFTAIYLSDAVALLSYMQTGHISARAARVSIFLVWILFFFPFLNGLKDFHSTNKIMYKRKASECVTLPAGYHQNWN